MQLGEMQLGEMQHFNTTPLGEMQHDTSLHLNHGGNGSHSDALGQWRYMDDVVLVCQYITLNSYIYYGHNGRWIYKNGLLTSNSDILYISSSLLRKLIIKNEIQLLNTIFGNFKFYGNDFIKMLLFQYKNKISTSLTSVNGIIGNENLVKYLVELGADVNKENKFNETPLYCACRKGNEKIVKYLIEHGANVNRGNEKIVKYLVEHGADVNKINQYNETPLYGACEEGNEKIVKYLVEHGANIKIDERGNKNLVKYLVELGADINDKSRNGDTPLIMARKSRNGNLVKYLVEHGAVINKEIPQFRAIKRGNEPLIKYLVEHGADIKYK
ncbi:ankyrin repeat-containing domain protein [Neocallimastix sp. 'constans']